MGDCPVTPFCWRDHGWRGGQGKTEGEASKSRWPGGKLGYLVAGVRKSTPDTLTSSRGVWWLVGLAAVRPRPEALAKPEASVFLRLLADEGHLGFWLSQVTCSERQAQRCSPEEIGVLLAEERGTDAVRQKQPKEGRSLQQQRPQRRGPDSRGGSELGQSHQFSWSMFLGWR